MTVIKKLELIHFGKFSDTVIDLKNGVNRFCEQNEWGKSTVTDFIIYMLYGFKKTASKKIGIEDNFLKKYLPWKDDSFMFGAMELEHDSKHIRIERKTYATGRMNVTVTDASGALLPITEPGVQLFGIDAQTFMRTFLVRQTDIVFDGTDDIETALKNLVTTGDEQTSFDAALKVIADKKNKYQHGDRRSGRIFELPRLITNKKLELSSLTAKQTELSDSLLQYNSTLERLRAVEKTEKELEGKKTACIGNDAKKIVARAEEILSESAEYSEKLTDGTVSITEQDVKNATDVFNSEKLAESFLQNAAAQKENVALELDNVKQKFKAVEYVGQNEQLIVSHLAKKPKANIPLIVVGLLVAIVCAVLSAVVTLLFAIGIIAGAALAAIALFIKTSPKPILNKTNEQLKADYECFKSAVIEINAATEKLNAADADYKAKKDAFDRAQNDVSEIKQKYGINELSELSTLLAHSKNASMLGAHVERLKAELKDLLKEKPLDEYRELSKNADGSDLGVLELERMLAKTAEQKSECALALSRLEKARIECVDIRDKINATSADISALESELKDAEYQNRVLEIARDTLEMAYDKINSVYSPIVSQKISPYLSTLTNGKYSETVVDRQFNIRVKYKGEYKELGFFSRGTADAVYLAVRLAMAEILEGDKKLPLILDDPFWSFDTDRLENANKLLNELAQNRQILVFCAK